MSNEVNKIIKFLDERSEANKKALNEAYITDTGKDRSEYLKGVSGAYASVRYFIERGLRDD